MLLVDFHTHSATSNNSKIIAVKNLDLEKVNQPESHGYYTIGLHPWESNRLNLQDFIGKIQRCMELDSVIGLGEIGLDKLKGASMEIQKEILVQQVSLAYKMQKPIIIHCVKAWDELLEVRKSFSDQIPWAIHGFNGSLQLGEQLINAGFYLSVGPTLLRSSSKIRATLGKLPLDRLFFETDDSGISIETIYNEGSNLLKQSVSTIAKQLYANFISFFGKQILGTT
ncbi:MAG: TatD family hydrolase [Bacteroidales bacterium]|nr:TatD family hydrolase [Bacteroidales bacterium]